MLQCRVCIGLSWYIIFSLAIISEAIIEAQKSYQMLNCNKGEWDFLSRLQHFCPVTVMLANMRNPPLQTKSPEL